MVFTEVELTASVLAQLMALSEAWEEEGSCHGYRKNMPEDIRGSRVFLALEGEQIAGYLFGRREVAGEATSVYPAGTAYFEVEELYVKPPFRNQGIGKKLFRHVEREVAADVDMLMLSTATKNFRAILRFYIDELGMEFWSARLFKRI